MAQNRSQAYDIDNRYRETELNGGGTFQEASDNISGKRFVQRFIEENRLNKKNPIGNQRDRDNKFIFTEQAQGQFGPVSGELTFKNLFRASQKDPD